MTNVTRSAEQIWTLTKPRSTQYHADWADEMAELSEGVCPLKPKEHPHAHIKRVEQLSILLNEPRGVSPITWTWGPGRPVVREDVLQILRQHKVTGFEAKPVKARYELSGKAAAQAPLIPPLWELQVRGWGGVAPEESGTQLEEYCPGCGYRRYSDITNPEKIFDESQWDGSDVFMIWPLPAYCFITDRVANIIRQQKWQRCRLIPIEELSFSGSGLCPGELRAYMPLERAKALGEPWGIC